MSELVTDSGDSPGTVDLEIAALETALLDALERIGLPSAGVLVDLEERKRVVANFPAVVSSLGEGSRTRAIYLSKLLAAVGAGLFDAALNYLWDETIAELRRRIGAYDLAYFFDIAAPSPERRQSLQTEEDLTRLDDQELIRTARDISLISNVGYQQLDLIRYMRNHASAAHPNHNDITAFQLVGWIETCIKEVITLPESVVMAQTRRLLVSVRSGAIDAAEAARTAEFFVHLPTKQADNIGAGLFGIYLEPTSTEQARDAIRLLLPVLWPQISEEQRQLFGLRYGRHVANGEVEVARRARDLLDVVNAAAYLPEPVRVADIASTVEELLSAHRGFNNFYAETAPARRLSALVGDQGVPDAVRQTFVAAVVETFLTNGSGVAWGADPHYQTMISRFSPVEAEMALLRLFDPTVSSRLRWEPAREKFVELLAALEAKVTRPVGRDLLAGIRSFTGPPDAIAIDTSLERLAERVGAAPRPETPV